MKKRINILIYSVILMGVLLVLASSCKKDDFTNPKNLSGTEWKSEIVHQAGIYYILKFTGKTTYQLYNYEPPIDKLEFYQRGSYSIDGNNIEFTLDDDDYVDRGVINGEELTFYDLYDGDVIFTKQ